MKIIKKVHDISRALESLSAFGEIDFVWRFVDSDMLQNVTRSQIAHSNRYCNKVKMVPCRKLHLCIRDHAVRAFELALSERRPFIMRCHARVVELAVPVFCGGNLLGVLFAGAFRDPEGRPVGGLEEEYFSFLQADEEKLLALGDYLERTIHAQLADVKVAGNGSGLLPDIKTDDGRIIQAASYMRTHCRESITAGEVADVAALSSSRLLHLFTKEVGFSFSDWLQRLRVSEAQRLVEGTDVPLGMVAETCGFSDQSRMTVLFKRYFGESPSRLREKARRLRKTDFA